MTTERTTTRKAKKKSAKAKAAKPATTKKPATGKQTDVRKPRDADKTIKLLAKENPYKGKRGAGFALLKDGMTVEEYYAAGRAKGHAASLLRSVIIVGTEGKHIALNGKK